MRKASLVGILIVCLTALPSQAVYVKIKNGMASTDTTALDDWQSTKNTGLFLVEDISVSPEYSARFESDIYDLTDKGDYWEFSVVYKANETYSLQIKLLKLKTLRRWKGEIPPNYVYSVSRGVTDHLQKGDLAVISIHRFTDTAEHGSVNVMNYNIKNFEQAAGGPFIYASIDNMTPVFRVLENKRGELFISGCVDGLTKRPLRKPLLTKVEDLLLPVIDEPPETEFVGIFPAQTSGRKVKKCRKTDALEKSLIASRWIAWMTWQTITSLW